MRLGDEQFPQLLLGHFHFQYMTGIKTTTTANREPTVMKPYDIYTACFSGFFCKYVQVNGLNQQDYLLTL